MWEAVLQPRVTPGELVAKRGGRNESAMSENSGSDSGTGDSELSSIILQTHGTPAAGALTTTAITTILQPEHVVPPTVLLSEIEAAAMVPPADQGDIEAPPVSGGSVPQSVETEEQASSSSNVILIVNERGP